MQIMINLPDAITARSNDAEVTFNVADIPADKVCELVAQAAVTGFVKTLNDAASGAAAFIEKWNADPANAENQMTKTDAAHMLMSKRVTTFLGGDWGRVGTGDGIDPVEMQMISLVRKTVAGLDAKKYKNADETERRAMCRAYIATLSGNMLATIEKAAKIEVAASEAEKARKAEMAALLAGKVKQ